MNTGAEGEDAHVPETTQPPRRGREVEWALTDNLLVAVILLQATFLLVVSRKLVGVDSWLTLVSGREISQHGLPRHEVLTTIPAGRVWTDQQWLAQLVYYELARVGLGLAVVVHALMVSAALAICVVASRVRGASSRMTLVAAIVCLVVAPWSWQLRAQSLAFPLFALTLALLVTDRRLAARRTLLVFPALIVWANVHGSVLLGVVIASLAGLVALVEARREKSRPWRPLAFLVAPWACALASPYTTDLVAYYRLLLVDSPVSRYITEWQAPELHGYFLVFFAVAAATLAIAVWQRRRLSPYDLAVLALTLAGAVHSVRAVVWFSLAFAMLMPLALDGIVPPSPAPPVHRRLAAGLIAALAAVLAVTMLFTLSRHDSWFEHGWSVAGVRAAERAAPPGSRRVVWADGTLNDWLLWKAPSLRGRVAWDARFELLTEPELRAIVRFNAFKPGWRGATSGYSLILLDRDAHPDQVRELRRERGTRVLYADKAVILLERRHS